MSTWTIFLFASGYRYEISDLFVLKVKYPERNMDTPHINPLDFHTVTKKLREFFEHKGWVEVHTQSRLSILAACEDDLVSVRCSFIQARNFFWSILKIAIHHDNPVAGSMIKAGRDRAMLSKIT